MRARKRGLLVSAPSSPTSRVPRTASAPRRADLYHGTRAPQRTRGRSDCEQDHTGRSVLRAICGAPEPDRAGKMKNRIDFVTIATATCVAAYVAIMLDHVANVDFGFSEQQIRSTAVVIAIVMAMLMAIDFLGKKLVR